MQAIYTNDEIKSAYEIDAKMIEASFTLDNQLGKDAIAVAISGFVDLLIQQKGNLVPQMDLDYRRYIVGLIGTLMEIITDDLQKAIVFSQLMLR